MRMILWNLHTFLSVVLGCSLNTSTKQSKPKAWRFHNMNGSTTLLCLRERCPRPGHVSTAAWCCGRQIPDVEFNGSWRGTWGGCTNEDNTQFCKEPFDKQTIWFCGENVTTLSALWGSSGTFCTIKTYLILGLHEYWHPYICEYLVGMGDDLFKILLRHLLLSVSGNMSPALLRLRSTTTDCENNSTRFEDCSGEMEAMKFLNAKTWVLVSLNSWFAHNFLVRCTRWPFLWKISLCKTNSTQTEMQQEMCAFKAFVLKL